VNRWIGGCLVVGVLAIVAVSLAPSAGTRAQNGTEDDNATAIADLQTRVAVLETVQAGDLEPAQLQATQIADLQTRVAALETAIAGSPSTSASGEAVLFEANAQTGFDDWTDGYFGGFANQFTVQDGILVAEEGGYTVLYAPYLTTSPDYILEAEIQLIPPGPGTPETATNWTIAGLAARYKDNGFGEDDEGYTATTQGSGAEIEAEEFTSVGSMSGLPGAGLPDVSEGWHVYRFELRGDQLRFLIDGVLIAEGTDSQFTGFGADGRVGIVASLGPLEVRSFRVLAWE
jgi:hypothetical protein